MKNVKENLKAVATYSTADTINAEGFAAWTSNDVTLLEQLSMTGTLGNSFYASYSILDGKGVLWYNDRKFYLCGRIIGPEWFAPSAE